MMAVCKFCGKSVPAANVWHGSCWEKAMEKTAEEFCEDYCRFPRELSEEELREHCDSCALIKLVNAGL